MAATSGSSRNESAHKGERDKEKKEKDKEENEGMIVVMTNVCMKCETLSLFIYLFFPF